METVRLLWNTISEATIETPYTSEDPAYSYQLNAFLDSLSAGLFDGEYSQWREARNSIAQELRNNDYQHIDGDQLSKLAVAGIEEKPNIYFDAIRNRTHNRRFILIARGYMGLAPSVVAVGDSCAIIFGCKTPCILRKVDTVGLYTYVGSTPLMGKNRLKTEDADDVVFRTVLGEERCKDWVEWDVEEQDIYLR